MMRYILILALLFPSIANAIGGVSNLQSDYGKLGIVCPRAGTFRALDLLYDQCGRG